VFIDFFYELKKKGIPVTLIEWLDLMEALSKGLSFSSLTGFYYLARSVLIKSESHFDSYDIAFSRYFKGIETPEEIIEDALNWLDRVGSLKFKSIKEKAGIAQTDIDELRQSMANRLNDLHGIKKEEQQSAGTGGESSVGNHGIHPNGFRMGGDTGGLSAIKVAAERKYRGYRNDKITGVRQFEMALRSLRQLSSRVEGPKDQLDLDETIGATGQNGGFLKLIWDRPRQNMYKVIVLMDSAGSIDRYHDICSRLFTAANRTTHFKEIKFYYFHNCIYDKIYTNYMINEDDSIKTVDFLRTNNSDYRLIIVGDAAMAPSELTKIGGAIAWDQYNKETGITWLKRLARHFPYSIWLNPVPSSFWGREPDFVTVNMIRDIFPMFELNPRGLEQGIKKIRTKNH